MIYSAGEGLSFFEQMYTFFEQMYTFLKKLSLIKVVEGDKHHCLEEVFKFEIYIGFTVMSLRFQIYVFLKFS